MIKLKVYSLLENLMTCAWKSKVADSSPTTRLMSHDSCVSPAGIYLVKVNTRNTRTRCEVCSKLTPCSSASIVNFEHVIVG